METIIPIDIRILSLLALTYLENGDEHKAMEATERLFTALDQVEDKQQEDFESLYRAGQYLFCKYPEIAALRRRYHALHSAFGRQAK